MNYRPTSAYLDSFSHDDARRVICGTLVWHEDEMFTIYALTMGKCGALQFGSRLQDCYMLWSRAACLALTPRPIMMGSAPHWFRLENRVTDYSNVLHP